LNPQQEAVALWKFLESRGIAPSIRKVVAMMRVAGIPISDGNARTYLARFAAASPHPKAIHHKITAHTPHAESTPAAQITHGESTGEALTYAVEVSLPSKKEPAAPAPAALDDFTLSADPPKPKRAPIQPRLDVRTPAQITADEVLASIADGIKGALKGMTWTTWRTRNRKLVVDMAVAGLDAEDIVEAWTAGSERRGYPVLNMGWIAEDLNRAPGGPAPNASDLLPTLTELIAAGKIEPLDSAAIIAGRPDWFNAELAARE
jgi:hypothetical protein